MREQLAAVLRRSKRATWFKNAVREVAYRRQSLLRAEVAGIQMLAPPGHPVIVNRVDQPLRDLAIGLIAAQVAKAHPESSFLDIGANIGDTAAIMRSGAPNPIILVEPSDYFRSILERNIVGIPDIRRIESCLVGVSGGGRLRHWGGTAEFEPGPGTTISKSLAEVADPDTKFVKIDTDGYDFSIIRGALPWLRSARPVLYYEDDCSTSDLEAEANATISDLRTAGYNHFVFWRDTGDFLAATDDPCEIAELHRRLLDGRQARTPGLSNYDVLAVTDDNVGVLSGVCGDKP